MAEMRALNSAANLSRRYFTVTTALPALVNETTHSHHDTDWACHTILTGDEGVMTSYQVFMFSSLLSVIVGFGGNLVSLLVFSRKSMRTLSSSVYLWMLSVSDTCYLINVFLCKVVPVMRCLYLPDSTFDIYNRSDASCKILQYLVDFFSDYSTVLILAFTVERYMACYHMVMFRNYCTVSRARAFCAITLVVIAVVIAPQHWLFMGIHEGSICVTLMEYEYTFVLTYLCEMGLFRVIPVFIIFGLNIRIIVKIYRLNKQKKERRRSSAVICSKTNQGGMTQSKEERHLQLTTLLLIVSSAYIILYFPILIHYVVWWLHRLEIMDLPTRINVMTQNYAKTLYVMGFAINFFLYTLSGRVFRDQLRCIACGLQKSYQEIQNNYFMDDNRTECTAVQTLNAPPQSSPQTRSTEL